MKNYEIRKISEAFEAHPSEVVSCRRRYLTGRLWELDDDKDFWAEGLEGCNDTFYAWGFVDTCQEIENIKAELARLEKLLKQYEQKKTNQVTEEMIQAAKDAPITSVIAFTRGQVACPFHDDKHPSAYNGTRTNRLVCPVCNKTWSTIDILMLRDGMTFIDAVKYLAI